MLSHRLQQLWLSSQNQGTKTKYLDSHKHFSLSTLEQQMDISPYHDLGDPFESHAPRTNVSA
jgi:hypothetical protein